MKNKLTLPITIRTGYEKTIDETANSRMRINHTSFYINALFWAISMGMQKTEFAEQSFSDDEMRGNVELLCWLGLALSNELPLYSEEMDFPDSLANHLAAFMQDPQVPTSLRNSMSNVVVDFVNEHGEQVEENEIESLSEILARILRGVEAKNQSPDLEKVD